MAKVDECSGSVAFNWDLNSGMGMRFVVDYSYQDSVDTNRESTDPSTGQMFSYDLPSYWLVNARLALLSANAWELTLFGANLFDEEYLTDYTRFNQGIVQVVGLPRTYGLRFKYDF